MAGPSRERDAGGQDGIDQLAPRGDPQPPVVEEGALALLGPEQLVGHGIVGDARHHGPLPLQGDGDREVGQAVEEVGGAVERVDDPGMGLVGAFDESPLLGQDAVARTGLAQLLDQGLLGLDVRRGDEVRRPLLRDLQLHDLAEIARQAAPGLARRRDHHLQEGGGGAQRTVLNRRGAGIRRYRWRPRSARRRS